MKEQLPPIPLRGTVTIPSTVVQPKPHEDTRSIATRDHDVIRNWAARHREPATGEASASGPATIDVSDGGVGLRFNFPGMAKFRPIPWEEWLEHFDQHQLVFVYEEKIADRAYEIWKHRGGDHGHDREDWFEAERELRQAGRSGGARYRLVCQES